MQEGEEEFTSLGVKFLLTARQYGEVVLPDVIPADHLSWFFSRGFLSAGKGGYGALFAVMIQILLRTGACRDTSLIGAENLSPVTKLGEGTGVAKAVQTISKVVIYHGAVF